MRILVTGGAGYVGSVTAARPLETILRDAWAWHRAHPSGYEG